MEARRRRRSGRASAAFLFPVFAGGHAGGFLEHSCEMALTGKAQIHADGGDRFIRIAEEAFGLFRFFVADKGSQRYTSFLCKAAGQMLSWQQSI